MGNMENLGQGIRVGSQIEGFSDEESAKIYKGDFSEILARIAEKMSEIQSQEKERYILDNYSNNIGEASKKLTDSIHETEVGVSLAGREFSGAEQPDKDALRNLNSFRDEIYKLRT